MGTSGDDVGAAEEEVAASKGAGILPDDVRGGVALGAASRMAAAVARLEDVGSGSA